MSDQNRPSVGELQAASPKKPDRTLEVGWSIASIGQLCTLTNGRAFKQAEWSKTGLPIIRIQNLNKKDAPYNYYSGDLDEKHLVKPGDLLFAWSGTPGTSFGTHLWKGEDAALNQHIFKIDFYRDLIDKSFLRYAIDQKLEELIGSANGGVGLRHVTKGTFEKTEVAFPPLAEQKVIADKLDTLLAQVESTKARLQRLPDILKHFRQSVLSAAVSGKLTEEWRGDGYQSDSKVPLSWEVKPAEKLCEKVQSGSTPRNDPFNQKGTIPFLKVYNIVNQKIDFEYKSQFITDTVHEEKLKRSIAYPGDILMNIVGPPLGKVAVLTDQYPEWNLNQAITIFRVNKDVLNNLYLYYVLCEGELVRTVMPDTKGSVGQVNISLTQCRKALIPVPPLNEQTEIVRRVEELFQFADQIEQKANAALERVNNLTQSILAKAFRGELTAGWREQNPDLISGENSAEALLEKIKAEREKLKPKKKTARKKAKA